MTLDSDEVIKRMEKLIEEYSKYGYMEEMMYRMAVGNCIEVIRQMAGGNNDVARQVHSIHGKRVLRENGKK